VVNDQMHQATSTSRWLSVSQWPAVRLQDVAEVYNGAQNIRTGGYLNGIPSITVIIFRQLAQHYRHGRSHHGGVAVD